MNGASLDHDQSISGVLPLFVVRSPLVGRSVMTPPGGMCASDEESARALIDRGLAVARQVKADRFVFQDTRQAWLGDFETACEHENWIVDVRMGEDALWQELDRNIRRQVRMAKRNDLTATIDRTGDLLDAYYAVFSQFAHEAGTPVFGRAFLENIMEEFPNGFNIVVVFLGEKPVGGYFQLAMGNTVYGAWGATLHEYLDLRPVYLAYWEILSDTIQQGYEFLDMGRSPADSNASKYKGQWSGSSVPVYQQVASLRSGEAAAMATRAQTDGKFQLIRQIWPKLPAGMAQYLGPKLRRHVPFA